MVVALLATIAPEAGALQGLQVPGQVTGLEADTTEGSLDVDVDWDDVAGAADYWVRWRVAGPGQALNDGVRVSSSQATITVADYGSWVVRVEACNTAGCGPAQALEFDVTAAPGDDTAADDTGEDATRDAPGEDQTVEDDSGDDETVEAPGRPTGMSVASTRSATSSTRGPARPSSSTAPTPAACP